MATKAPLVSTLTYAQDAVAAGASQVTPAFKAPFAGTVSAVEYVPRANITGADTNTRTIRLVNKGAAGSGTTVVATLTLALGTDATAAVPKPITLSAVDGATTVAEGDILQWESNHAASGLADPGGVVRVTISRS